jgi:hypothetical protein
MHFDGMKAQGATEYLVLLAVVLIVALVSVALLGFFPGMASDAKMTQSETYWKGAAPISVVEGWAQAYASESSKASYVYLMVKNSGAYPIRITKIIGGSHYIDKVYPGGSYINITDNYYMGPGEVLYFGGYLLGAMSGLSNRRAVMFCLLGQTCGWDVDLPAAQSVCAGEASNGQYGYLSMKDFGFEYIEYIEGQQLTKRQIGTPPLILRCNEPHA